MEKILFNSVVESLFGPIAIFVDYLRSNIGNIPVDIEQRVSQKVLRICHVTSCCKSSRRNFSASR